jgi:hypothetical protein
VFRFEKEGIMTERKKKRTQEEERSIDKEINKEGRKYWNIGQKKEPFTL